MIRSTRIHFICSNLLLYSYYYEQSGSMPTHLELEVLESIYATYIECRGGLQ